MAHLGCMHSSPLESVSCKYCGKVQIIIRGNEACLERHISKCRAKIDFEALQMGLIKSSNESNYDDSRTQKEVVDFILKKSLPLEFSNDRCFQDMLRKTFSHSFTKFSVSSTKNHILDQFKEEKKKLLSVFNEIEGKVCLTCNLSDYSSGKLQYLSLTAHYVDQNWRLQKKLISFRPVKIPYTGFTVGKVVNEEIVSWGLKDKIFSLTLDNNAKYNESFVENVGRMIELPLDGTLYCIDHVLHLIVKDGFDFVSLSIEKLRNAIVTINSSTRKNHVYEDACKKAELPCKMLPLDVCRKWNSTYTMLKVALDYRKAFDLYYLGLPIDEEQEKPCNDVWDDANFVKDLLKFYDESTNISCALTGPSYRRVQDLLTSLVSFTRKSGKVDGYFNNVEELKINLNKYLGVTKVPMYFTFALIMDPRNKIGMTELLFEFVYGENYFSVTECISTLKKLFEEYKCRIKIDSSEKLPEEKIQEEGKSRSSSPTSLWGENDYFRATKRMRLERLATIAKNEIQYYLDIPLIEYNEDVLGKFDVLDWWKVRKDEYPVLAIMARDLLTVPFSTRVFNKGERTLSDDYCMQLGPEMAEAVVCIKEWLQPDVKMSS